VRKQLPDFPWDALAPYADRAREHAEGAIDLSVGTPVDSTPQIVQSALANNANSPRYPLTAGTPELRSAISSWAKSKLGATGDFDVLPVIGSKELVAWLPTFLQSKKVVFPEVAYPTYLVGALLAESEIQAVAVDADSWPQADLAWVNSPSNPTGRVHSESELKSAIAWSRKNNAILASDECYFEFGDGAEPTSILKYTGGDNKNILALHSLSKRSSMAGYRAAFLIGDPSLISAIREVRKHTGMMVALPVQHAMIAALGDEQHVAEQRNRYNARRATLRPALVKAGFRIDESAAGLYIWCTRNENSWDSIEWLSKLGIIATPGVFYGEKGSSHVRLAMTATDSEIKTAAARIEAAIKL